MSRGRTEEPSSLAICGEAGSALLTGYLCILIPFLSFYAPEGYWELGYHKFAAYRAISLLFGAPLLAFAVAALVLRGRKEETRFRVLPIDAAAIAYAVLLTISFLLSENRTVSLWGFSGWQMGWLTELLFLLFYFFARLFPIRLLPVAVIAGISGGGVVLLALMERLRIYPLPFMGADYEFLSTIGNVDWYCGYLAIALSLALGGFFGDVRGNAVPARYFAAQGVLLAVLSLLTQGSEGGLLVLVVAVLTAAALRLREGRGWRILACAARGGLLVMLVCFLVLLLAFAAPSFWGPIFDRLLPFSVLNDEFGSLRGAAWRISWEFWSRLPWFRKLFGIGPDAYTDAVYAVPAISQELTAVFQDRILTNPHSEYFAVLINEGLFAAAAALLFMLSGFAAIYRRFRAEKSALALMALFAVMLLGAEQAITFRTVTATPFLFLLLGAALSDSGMPER